MPPTRFEDKNPPPGLPLSRGEYFRQLRVVAAREEEPAMEGGRRWREFVAWAERTLGQPWEVIRDDLNGLHGREGKS